MLQYFILSKKTTYSLTPYFNQYLLLYSDDFLKDINDQNILKDFDHFQKLTIPMNQLATIL